MAHDPDSSNADSSIVAILAWGFRQHPVAELVAGIPEMEVSLVHASSALPPVILLMH